MYERFTEQAIRAIFFARHATSELGARNIEPEHLLLGVLRAAVGPTRELLKRAELDVSAVRHDILARVKAAAKVPTSTELPFSSSTKRILAAAATEADQLGHVSVGTEHLLLGILGESETVAAQLLQAASLSLDSARAHFGARKPKA